MKLLVTVLFSCERKGSTGFVAIPEALSSECFHFFMLIHVIDHPKRKEGAVGIQCSFWGTLEGFIGDVYFSEDFLFDWVLEGFF